MISKYGVIDGKRKWKEYLEKQAYSNSYEYKNLRYGWTLEQYNEYNKKRSSTLDNFMKRHGKILGKEKWEEYRAAQSYTNTLEYFISKYGVTKGEEKWKEYNVAKSKPFDPTYIMEKYDCSLQKALDIISERKKSTNISKTEMLFIDKVLDIIPDIKYTYKTKQFSMWSHQKNCIYMYDLACTKRKKIVEYNGDYWHCNPKIYESDYKLKQSNMRAEEIWDRDKDKISVAESRGFEVKVVWESDFLKDQTKILNEVRYFLDGK